MNRKHFLIFATLLFLLQMFGCAENPSAPLPNNTTPDFRVLGVTFTAPEINQHDTSLTVNILLSLQGTPDNIRYQTQIGVIHADTTIDSTANPDTLIITETTYYGRIINDTLALFEHPSPISAFTGHVFLLARVNYWTPRGEFWYSREEKLDCITVNRP